jgi:hypothetical protein
MPLQARAGDFKNPDPLGDGVCTRSKNLALCILGIKLFFQDDIYLDLFILTQRDTLCCFRNFFAGYLRFYGEATTSSSYGGYGKDIRIIFSGPVQSDVRLSHYLRER